MVNPLMFMFSLLFILFANGVKGAELLLIIDKSTLEFGQYSLAQLYAIDIDKKIIHIDFDDLEENFGVVIVETVDQVEDDRWPGQSVQLIELKLYPRRTGKIEIPALKLSDSSSNSQSLMAVPGIGVIENPNSSKNIDIKWSTSRPWQRELVTVMVEITTTEAFVSLESEALTMPGFDVFPIAPASEKIIGNGSKYFKLSIGWAIFPLIEGDYKIELPAIEFRQFSQTLRSYFLPKQSLIVKPLPVYIPPTMPVGKITLSSDMGPNKIYYPDSLSSFKLRITGEGVSPRWVPSLRSQLLSSSQLTFYNIKSQQTSSASRDGFVSTVMLDIPFKALQSGRLRLADLQTQYFDPVTAKIVKVEHHASPVFVIAFAWRVLLGLLIVFLITVVIRKTYHKYMQWYKRRGLRLVAVTELQSANTPFEIRQALNDIAASEGWSSNMTLTAWLDHWQSFVKNGKPIKSPLQRLSEACYGKTKTAESTNIRDDLLTAIRNK